METYKVYIKIDGIEKTFLLTTKQSEFVTEDQKEAIKCFNQQMNELNEYEDTFSFSKRKIRLNLQKDNKGIFISSITLKEEIFNLTDKLLALLNQSGIIIDQ